MLPGRMPGLPLTTVGQEQAARLADYLAGEPIRYIVSSPIQRARETAAPFARARGLTVDLSDAITEVDAGDWTGRTFAALDTDETWRRFNRFRSATRIPMGESMLSVQERFVGEMLRLRDQFPDHAIALVSHADPIKAALACFLGAPLDFYDRFEIGLGSVSVLSLDDWNARVIRLNHVPYEGK